jgi:hypothetical protein
MESNVGFDVLNKLTRRSRLVVSGEKEAMSFARANAKISRSEITAKVASLSYPVSKMDWFQWRANSAYGQSTQNTRANAKRV